MKDIECLFRTTSEWLEWLGSLRVDELMHFRLYGFNVSKYDLRQYSTRIIFLFLFLPFRP